MDCQVQLAVPPLGEIIDCGHHRLQAKAGTKNSLQRSAHFLLRCGFPISAFARLKYTGRLPVGVIAQSTHITAHVLNSPR